MKTVAFLGLGHMGLPMAANLVKAGYAVRGYDLADACRVAAKEAGIPVAADSAEAIEAAEVIITMLPKGEHVVSAYGDLVKKISAGTLLIDCSTVDMESALKAHELAASAGCPSVDAPVSGGTGGAAAGTLTFMCGGDAEAFSAAKPVLEAMGKKIVHCGKGGNGQAAKICNNMILGISMIAVSEAFVLGENSAFRIRRCSMSPPPPRGNAGRSPPIARCRDQCRHRPPTRITSRDLRRP